LIAAAFACTRATAQPAIEPAGVSLIAESCAATNGVIDPGETVSVEFSLRNAGSSPTTNLVATLLATGGINTPGGPQSYGSLAAGGAAVTRAFTFTANAACGSTITATIQLQDGPTSLGSVNFSFQLGASVTILSESFDSVSAPNLPAAWLATNSAGTGVVWTTTSTTRDSSPNSVFAPDPASRSDNQLISPSLAIASGAALLTFRHSFGFETGFDGGRLEISIGGSGFSDIVSAGGGFVSGGYNNSILFGSVPAWSGSSGGFMTTKVRLPESAAGQNVQFRWRLTSDSSGAGTGWYVDTISVSDVHCCAATDSADLAITISATPEPVLVQSNLTYTVRVTNHGPASATAVIVTNLLPVGVTNVVSVGSTAGSCTNLSGVIVCNVGTMSNAATATITIVVKPGSPGSITNTVSVKANEADFDLANNSANTVTTVNLPALSINDISITEGNSGTANAVFTVTLTPPSSKTVTVAYATSDGTAVAPADYNSASGVISFNPGQTSKTITVAVKGDTLSEADESYFVTLSNPTNAMLANAEGECTIIDNDPLPALSINNVSVVEGSSGTTNAVFNVTLSPASGQDVTVDFQTTDGTAVAGTDYLGINGTLLFSPGETNKTIPVPINGDSLNESNETFFLNLLNPDSATLGLNQGTCTIVNDDFLPSICLVDAEVIAESCFPTNGAIDPGETVTIRFSLKNIGTGTARTTNLVATLLATGGVSSPSGPQNYGSLTVGGAAGKNMYSLTASGDCGGSINATLQLQDGTSNLGTTTLMLLLGKPRVVLYENFDSTTISNLPGGWTASMTGIGAAWTTTSAASDTSPNSAFAPDTDGSSDDQLTSPSIAITTSSAQLFFRHNYATESFLDGGVLEISIANGQFQDILRAGGSFASGNYNGFINGGATAAWTGNSGGFISTKVTLPASAAGQSIHLRWRLLSDSSVGDNGWYVDNISVTDGVICCGGVSAPPRLSAIQSDGNISLSWPAVATGYRLLSSSNLASGSLWSPVTNSIMVTNGENRVSHQIQSGPLFFRLVNP
jgi:uncharacterized repeat protein (TIGR01451 family)